MLRPTFTQTLSGLLFLFINLLVSLNVLGQCDPITTLIGQNNNQDGIMFDIEAINEVTVNFLDANLCDVGPYDMEIYYKQGTHFGFEMNAGAWTLIGSALGVVPNPCNTTTVIPIPINITIPAGQIYSFYVTESANTGNNMYYSDGNLATLPGNADVTAQDANVIIYEGTGKDYAFGANFFPRIPNVTIDYDCCPPPDTLVMQNSCIGLPDGSIEVTGQGVAPWTYEISDVSGTLETSAPINGPYTFNNLIEGQYVVTATDADGCNNSIPVEVTTEEAIVLSPVITDNLCFGGSLGEVVIDVIGGTAPFDIVWTDPFGNLLQTDLQTNGTSQIDSLASGNFLVGVEDSSGCAVTASVTITEPTTQLNMVLNPTNLRCYESNDGEIAVSYDGISPYVFEVFDVLGFPVQDTISLADYSFENLDAGIYFVTATDSQGCAVTDDIEITQPDELEAEVSQSPVLCFNGNEGVANIDSILGGTTPYDQTLWNDASSQVGNTATDLNAGTYLATITDANGCELELEFDFDNPLPMSLEPRYYTDTCGQGKGAAFLDVVLGTPPYTYLWPEDSSDFPVLDSLIAGAYDVIVTDANNCKDSTTVEVMDDLPYPFSAFDYRLEGESDLDNEVQFINNSMGTSQWTWNYGDGESSNVKDPEHRFNRAGDYLVQLISSNGFCEDTSYQYVNINPLLTVYVPNAFTPGQNNINDLFFPQGEGIALETYDMFIYDRWGKLVWATGNFSKKWDGTNMFSGDQVQVGTYAYLIKFREFADLDRYEYTGTVNVIRD